MGNESRGRDVGEVVEGGHELQYSCFHLLLLIAARSAESSTGPRSIWNRAQDPPPTSLAITG